MEPGSEACSAILRFEAWVRFTHWKRGQRVLIDFGSCGVRSIRISEAAEEGYHVRTIPDEEVVAWQPTWQRDDGNMRGMALELLALREVHTSSKRETMLYPDQARACLSVVPMPARCLAGGHHATQHRVEVHIVPGMQ